MNGWIEKKMMVGGQKNMDGWMDKNQIKKNRWMVGWTGKNRTMVGWI